MTMGHSVGKISGLLPVYILCITLFYPVLCQTEPVVEGILVPKTELGGNASLICTARPNNAKVLWYFNDQPANATNRTQQEQKPIEDGDIQKIRSTLLIPNTVREDAGNYTCVAELEGMNDTRTIPLDLTFNATFISNGNTSRVEVTNTKSQHGNTATLECRFDMYYKPSTAEWKHNGIAYELQNTTWVKGQNRTVSTTLDIIHVGFDRHGTHECTVWDEVSASNVTGKIELIVIGDPNVNMTVMGISTSQLFVNWTIDPAYSQITSILLDILTKDGWRGVADKKIETNITSYVIDKLKQSTLYSVRLSVTTAHSEAVSKSNATTLDEDPVFVPNISIKGFSATSVTIGWAPPPEDIAPFIHYYLLEARKKDGGATRNAYHQRDPRNLPYMFDNLDPHSTYIFKVRSCQDFTKECGNWSMETAAATLDGTPGKPSHVAVNCTDHYMILSWGPPEKPNAEIKGYTIELTGTAEYRDRTGAIKKETWGPLSRSKTNDSTSARFDDLQPNTNYTIRLTAMTRSRRRGEEEVTHCKTLPARPDVLPNPRWRKILDKEKYLFKMYMPKVSERNGPICCYRVYMIRLQPGMELRSDSQPSLEIFDYDTAHSTNRPGAYVVDIFTNTNFPADNELLLGDGHSILNSSDPHLSSESCTRCLKRPHRQTPPTTHKPATTTDREPEDSTGAREEAVERKPDDSIIVKDGPLNSESNYTVFVELIPFPVENQEESSMYTYYLNQLMPAPSPVAPVPTSALEIALQATCAVAALVLLIMIIFCVMQTRRSRKLPPHANMEMHRLPKIIRYIWAGRQPLMPTQPAEMPPIAQEDLPAAYAERHADSDYGFQKEFELLQMLSECFPDRTTHASEARENQPKNRYPDIKAYDQTRVKLAQVDGITGSDYINANYVMGYKERKRFICAQGPTDTTVNDFWRMIWEHGLELIVMLTNLEEYSKVKCSKYWPDEVRGARAFGAVTVHHVQEKRYSDYIVRELKISKQPTNSDGQPIVENGGAKRNGDIKEGSESAPTSPREPKDSGEVRTVRQYHFLMWKDFAAPEHPHSILKFIKRVNEAWTNMVGRPVVVHCSAGVGRTGTLVALDYLLEQLKATGQVTVFNTIAELRRQRNFLVQSQKQYVFVYRALVEYGHYGDTEIPAGRLKAAIDRQRNTPEGADKCRLEHDFEKMLATPVVEVLKSCAAGQAEEVRCKNRAQDCLPYDRNRVMLSPIPGRDYSTYINASFVEAYDNSEGFIITQDPLPNTIFDFWRMVSEQSVCTIVMLSELGEGKCPRYWDDGTAQYEHISVQYDDSESCPYYTRRQFRLTNNKTGHTSSVRQLQYQGWPTAPGHVPEVTRGLAELADAVSSAQDPTGPMVVHCNMGTERSALFVALCILITALRTERRVDVSAVARKVRAQRSHTIDTFLQYEFLHRAILNYAELHNLLEDS